MPRRLVIVVAALAALNVILLVAGMGRGERSSCAGRLCVGLVFDVGGLGDKSFNDGAHRGLLKAQAELGVQIRTIEPGDGSDRESAVRQLASAGYDLVIGVGFIFTDDMRKLAAEFPGTRFACIDYSAAPGDPPPPPNLAGLRFREHEGSFLVGAIAGMVTKTKAVGFVGGMDVPLIHKFEAGYRAGVAEVCPDCKVLGAYAGTTPKAFADPLTGKELATTQYGRGADIIYHAAGTTGSGVFTAARQLGKKAIGVDSDQFDEAPCCVLTSMIKKVDVAVFESIRSLKEGEWKGGVQELGLGEGGMDFIWDERNRAMLPAEVVEKARALGRRIVAGEIEVPDR
ncbi:MAG TPA: BMP family ABC transporter substrate-binding protein [Kofleriaceae bacterium]|nr:BMP family ABC transporter substrate-binding protein [Kofleriaceae bacterium]